jgi:hypothetical protein
VDRAKTVLNLRRVGEVLPTHWVMSKLQTQVAVTTLYEFAESWHLAVTQQQIAYLACLRHICSIQSQNPRALHKILSMFSSFGDSDQFAGRGRRASCCLCFLNVSSVIISTAAVIAYVFGNFAAILIEDTPSFLSSLYWRFNACTGMDRARAAAKA